MRWWAGGTVETVWIEGGRGEKWETVTFNRIPRSFPLFLRREVRRRADESVYNQWVEIDHFEMAVIHLHHGFSGDARGERCNGCEDAGFRHGG